MIGLLAHHRLLATPRPHPTEGLLGLLLRTAEANGYPDFRWILHLAGLRRWSPFASVAKPLAEILNLTPEEIGGRLYAPRQGQPAERFASLRGIPLRRSHLSVRAHRFCPECLLADGFSPAEWDLALVTVCPEHRVRLVRNCPACGAEVSWHRDRLLHCQCGAPCREIPLQPASAALAALTVAVISKARSDGKAASGTGMPSWFTRLGLSDALDLILFLGRNLSRYLSGRRCDSRKAVAEEGAFETADAAAGILAAWPDRFFASLERFRAGQARGKERTGLEAEFGALYRALYPRRPTPSPALGEVRAAFEAYVSQAWTGGFVSQKNRRTVLGQVKGAYVTLAAGARDLHLHPSVLRKQVRRGLLDAVSRKMGRRTLTLIDRAALPASRSLVDDCITLLEARKILGLSKKPIRDLAQQGLLPAVSGPSVDGAAIWKFRRADIERLRDRIIGDHPASQIVPQTCCTFAHALRQASWRGLGAADLVKAVKDHELTVVARTENAVGIGQCVFQRNAVARLIGRSPIS
jgi:hypothetical protein